MDSEFPPISLLVATHGALAVGGDDQKVTHRRKRLEQLQVPLVITPIGTKGLWIKLDKSNVQAQQKVPHQINIKSNKAFAFALFILVIYPRNYPRNIFILLLTEDERKTPG